MNKTIKPAIFIESTIIRDFSNYIAESKYSSKIVLADENTEKYCLPVIKNVLGVHNVITIKSGERNKNILTCIEVWKKLIEANTDRKSLIINLGGGVICDMGGFIAATYMRGIDFIHIPTTLLAMCDACIGGKLAIDFEGNKNIIGIFHNPNAILIHTGFLKTLPEKHLMCGFAEIIKHALISDKKLLALINEYSGNINDLNKLIERSIKVKTKIVALDSFEKGVRKSLNFGHSIGHALETLSLYDEYDSYLFHGEAVAAGMLTESYISYKRNMLTLSELEIINKIILSRFKKVKIDIKDFDTIVSIILHDKKNERLYKLFTLLEGIGKTQINVKVSDEEIKEALEFYNSL